MHCTLLIFRTVKVERYSCGCKLSSFSVVANAVIKTKEVYYDADFEVTMSRLHLKLDLVAIF